MALTTLQSSWLTSAVTLADDMVIIADKLERLKAVYYNESVGTACTDEELQQLAEYKHLNHARVVALETAIEAVQTSLGDFTTGQLGNFLKASRTLGR